MSHNGQPESHFDGPTRLSKEVVEGDRLVILSTIHFILAAAITEMEPNSSMEKFCAFASLNASVNLLDVPRFIQRGLLVENKCISGNSLCALRLPAAFERTVILSLIGVILMCFFTGSNRAE